MKPTVFLFGEAEKGEYCSPLLCKNLPQMADALGNPPEESRGIHYGVQMLLFGHELIYFRVKEEGFSYQDYKKGIRLLKSQETLPSLYAIALPGVGDMRIIEPAADLCTRHKTILILTEKDLYDCLTSSG